jgi:hypothetical protein
LERERERTSIASLRASDIVSPFTVRAISIRTCVGLCAREMPGIKGDG